MSAMREKDQADFDLERFIDMFDTAMTSNDPRVVETLRKLMMIVALTAPETNSVAIDRQHGPLRRMFEDMNHLNRRMRDMEDAFRNMQREQQFREHNWKDVYRANDYEKYSLTAAASMAQSIDQDILRQVSKDWTKQINGGLVPPKGKLK